MKKHRERLIIRAGIPADFEQIENLRRHSDESLGSLGPRSVWDRLNEGSTLIAQAGKLIVGYVIWYNHRLKLPANIPIHQLCVDAKWRRAGIASQLITHLQEIALQRDVRGLSAWSRSTLPANFFFQARGFKPWATHPGGKKRSTPMIWWRLSADPLDEGPWERPPLPARAGFLSAARKRIRYLTVAEIKKIQNASVSENAGRFSAPSSLRPPRKLSRS